MRPNDKILLENIDDYFTHKGLPSNIIDDIEEKYRHDLAKSEAKNEDYIEYRGKSPAQIILTIQRNIFGLQINPAIFFIINFVLISYLYDKQFVIYQAATTMSICYCIILFPLTVLLHFRIEAKNYLYSNRVEMIMGVVIAILAMILIVMRAFNFNLGIVPVSMYGHQVVFVVGIALSLLGMFLKRYEFTGIGLLFAQKTIDAVIHNPHQAQIFSLVIWILIVVLVIYYTIQLSSRTKI